MTVANIGPRERRRRLRGGLVALAAAAIGAALLLGLGAPRGARVVLFLPLWAAGLGVFQAREKT